MESFPTPDDHPDREVLTWPEFGHAARALARAVLDDGWTPDVVIAVARGGLVPAGAVAYALDTKAMGTLNVEFYTAVGETLPDPVVLPPLMDTSHLAGRRALVVDDVADSGRTLALVMDLMRSHGAEARSAVLYTKPQSVIQPDYSWRETDRWIMFPWSSLPPVGGGASRDA
ncbi:phosphoribosyltransferase [Beutenbergia cavernae DSM 12333]|uniref:Phosphoribosyltransferase n=1 Tax=Beutenbergia cavernae (strain ATCC BAA-8 / DSM 12333 / CCUG 43141 / JCM 11478 / NBRC 16432 / NCIMB 13614 / HKI 0122) TaxID=471853 RepID=C5BV10_BEUC1|nr:phosphoribosyltransferase [Beutenbergia cavernae]ACQ78384.1 phosphoribosyltransferase [Beutenbergia cavernae DSM 12333]